MLGICQRMSKIILTVLLLLFQRQTHAPTVDAPTSVFLTPMVSLIANVPPVSSWTMMIWSASVSFTIAGATHQWIVVLHAWEHARESKIQLKPLNLYSDKSPKFKKKIKAFTANSKCHARDEVLLFSYPYKLFVLIKGHVLRRTVQPHIRALPMTMVFTTATVQTGTRLSEATQEHSFALVRMWIFMYCKLWDLEESCLDSRTSSGP